MIARIKTIQENFMPKSVFILSVCASLASAVLFAHTYDVSALVLWWNTLIDNIISGNFSEYQHTLGLISADIDLPVETNYPLFLNMAGALWMSPVYIILHLLHMTSHQWINILWVKLLLIICNFGIAKIIQLILAENNVDRNKQILVSVIYLLSPFVQFYSIGMGQIDALGLLFAMLAFLSLMREHNVHFIVFSVISILMKPFVIFIIVPLLIYAWHKSKKLTIVTTFIVIGSYILQHFLSDLLIYDYSDGSAYWNTFVFYPRLMQYTIFNIPVVIIIIALVCLFYLIMGYKHTLTFRNIIMCQSILLIAFETLMRQHPQWFIYFAAVSVMLLAISDNNIVSYVIYLLLETAFCLTGIFFFDDGYIVTSYSDTGLIGKAFTHSGFSVIEAMGDNLSFAGTVASILLAICSIAYVISILRCAGRNNTSDSSTKAVNNDISKNAHTLLLGVISYIPMLLLGLFVVIGYIY